MKELPKKYDMYLEPNDPSIHVYCVYDKCDQEILEGQAVVNTTMGIMHHDCFEDYIEENLVIERGNMNRYGEIE